MLACCVFCVEFAPERNHKGRITIICCERDLCDHALKPSKGGNLPIWNNESFCDIHDLDV